MSANVWTFPHHLRNVPHNHGHKPPLSLSNTRWSSGMSLALPVAGMQTANDDGMLTTR